MEYLKRINDLEYVIGSIHKVKGVTLGRQKKTKDLANKYFYELLKMVEYGNFDIVGHLDYLKRYLELGTFDENILYQILASIHYSNLALEVNTSGIRRCGDAFPSNKILEAYTRIGGKKITYGSDAHEESELFFNIKETSKQQKIYKLSPGVIVNHKFTSI